jgi:hypothetical protein
MNTPQIIFNSVIIILALAILVYSFCMIFYTARVISIYSKIEKFIFFSPFSKNQSSWTKKKWFYVFVKIGGVVGFIFTILYLFVAIYNMITYK